MINSAAINCPNGLGDILFCQTVFEHLRFEHPEIKTWYWYVGPAYTSLALKWNELDSVKERGLEFIPVSDSDAKLLYEGSRYVKVGKSLPPRAWAEGELGGNCVTFIPIYHVIGADARQPDQYGNVMFPKWDEYGISRETDWRTRWFLGGRGLKIDDESKLYQHILATNNITPRQLSNGEYVLFNEMYGTPPGSKRQPDVIKALNRRYGYEDVWDTVTPIIKMEMLPGTDLWDWIPYIKQCRFGIYTVETSVAYLCDMFATCDLFMFQKKQPNEFIDGFKYARGVYRNPRWQLVGDSYA